MQNAEVFTLTYGSIVRQLLSDLEDIDAVNKQLDQMCVPKPFFIHATLCPALQADDVVEDMKTAGTAMHMLAHMRC